MRTSSQFFKVVSYIILIILFLSGIWAMGYTLTSRLQIAAIWTCFGLLFLSYFIILKYFNTSYHYSYNIYLAITARILLLFSIPLLSDDFYRFIWDGQLLHQGINPFLYTPQQLIQIKAGGLDTLLFDKMNSPNYFSVYPPVNQFVFWLAAFPGKDQLLSSVVIFRIIIIFFEIGNIYLIKKLLELKNLHKNLLFLYALNPLVIMELSGNLHFEALMIFFTLLSVYLVLKNQWIKASFIFALAICTKLLPVLFIPLLIKQIGLKKTIFVSLITGLCCTIFFVPFIYTLDLLNHFIKSLRLYYGKFEFNGSIYQILKKIGWRQLNYNPIAYTSKILITLSLTGFLIAYWRSKNIMNGIFWLMFVYTLFGAIVHPWYILILIACSPFVKWRFGLIWSVLICLSYYTYSHIPYQENMGLVVVQYGLLFVFIVYEVLRERKFSLSK